jgi:hypothetical protein
MKPSEKLFKRLKEDLNLHFSENAKIRVLHTSRNEKSRGALSFIITESFEDRECALARRKYGSPETVSSLLKAKNLDLYDRGDGWYIEILGDA